MNSSENYWTCLKCKEQVGQQYEVCWNCQHDRSGQVPPTFLSLEVEDQAQADALSNKWRDKQCVQCERRLAYIGRKEFHEGMRWGALGDFGELFVSHTELEMYFCPTCRRVEFFV